ncbi:putative disease resistance protein RGA3 [Camellia lanceoleosa]|uniref:Disease resistance protein RGA3 n=1 Tax=Camellia lanceoleosa TaxID=1840588 RepID=A0ACC0FTC7_9ERIC|nr:putative disease resistance protein RGA3 [Camellia lanceoleosa]
MAEEIIFSIAKNILSKLGSYALQQIGLAWGVKKELKKMENTMLTIQNVLVDAQKQQVSNLAVKEWLQRLKVVVYDDDDLLDEVATEALKRQRETHRGMMREEAGSSSQAGATTSGQPSSSTRV